MTPGSWLVPGVSIDLGGLTLAPDIHHPPPYLQTGGFPELWGVRCHGTQAYACTASACRRRERGVHVAEELDELGPIDVIVIAYPKGAPLTGEAAPILADLVRRGVIRVLDALFVKKNDDGSVSGIAVTDLDGDGVNDVVMFEGARSGLLADGDAANAGEALEPGEAALILLYENSWAAPFAAAVRRNGGMLVASQRIPHDAVLEALDALESN